MNCIVDINIARQCNKCCDKKYECEYTCYHVFIDEDFCLSEIRVDEDE